jgi:hypothetical protein
MENIMNFLNFLNPSKAIVYEKHPHRPGHARLADHGQLPLVQKYGYSNTVNSHEFEQLSAKASQDNLEVLWRA